MDRNNILVLLSFIYFCSFILSIACQNSCTAGQRCIDLKDCPALNNLLQVRPVPQAAIDLLRKAHCGFAGKQPKVCCENEVTASPGGGNNNNLLPNENTCGIQVDERIFGGEETTIRQYPWMALLEYQKPNRRGFSCGGSLINNRYILTAAHCLKRTPKTWSLISVRLGEHDLTTPADCDTENPEPGFDECNDPQDIAIEEQIVHERYSADDKNQGYDIALLRLSRPIQRYTDFIKPLCLPLSQELRNQNYVGKNLTVAGWGKTENRSQSEVKLRVDVPVRSNSFCEPVYKKSGVTLVSSQICAGGVFAKDSCSGDSGGPLMVKDGTNFYAYGIVSFGPVRCGIPDFPGIYTKVADYVDWIQQNIRP